MKSNKISTKIKILGALLVAATFTVIVVSLLLNQKNTSDALIVNIAGKERMLSQKIAKNIFYIKASRSTDFSELSATVKEFIWGITTLKNGDESLKIKPAPTQAIQEQIEKVLTLWEPFLQNVERFKRGVIQSNSFEIDSAMEYISTHNNELLNEVDTLVTLYTNHIEEKTRFIKLFQYGAFIVLFLLVSFAIAKLKQIESHAQAFLQKSKELMQKEFDAPIEPMEVEGEHEIEEVANSMNYFIQKVNDTMQYSQSAIEKSQKASLKLEELSEEFSDIIGNIQTDKKLNSSINKSEDIMIQSSEDLRRTTLKLQNLKKELDSLLNSCAKFDVNQKK